MEIHRHTIHLHIEQVVQLILIKEGAPIDGGDAWQPSPFREDLQAQVCQAAFEVEAIGQFELFGQPSGTDLHQAGIARPHLAYSGHEPLEGNDFNCLCRCHEGQKGSRMASDS